MLLALVVAFGRALAGIPLGLLQVTVGALLLLFGMRWLHKAVLRSVGVIPLHDETAAFSKQVETMRTHGTSLTGWDRVAFAGAFQITMLEGIEVVFIVSAMSAGGTGLLVPVSLAAVSALLAVAALGLAIRRPLARVPENQLKFVIGVLLSAFGSFCFGEGLGVAWPGEDVSILVLAAGFFATALLARALCGTNHAGHAVSSDVRNVP